MATLYYNNATSDGNWATVPTAATGSVSFSDQPADGDTLNINGVVFEFDSDSTVTEGNTAVVIGVDLATTLATLEPLVEAAVPVAATVDGSTMNLAASSPGTAGNYGVVATGSVMSATSMTGGTDTNWWTDEACTIPATSLPTSSDSVVVTGSLSQNTSGSEPTVVDFTMSGGSWSIAITVTGTATFNGSTSAAYNYGTITGNVTFDGANASNDYTLGEGTVVGNATFQNGANNLSQINGNATFLNGSANLPPYGRQVTGDATFDAGSSTGPSYNSGAVAGGATFYGNSYNSGSVNGTATFNASSPTYGWGDCRNIGTVGTGVFNNYSTNGYYSSWPAQNLSGNVSGNATFTNAYNVHGTVSGDATFEGYARNGWNVFPSYPYPWTAGDFARVFGTATFNDDSVNGQWAVINNTATFNDFSRNEGSSTIYNHNTYQYQPALGALVFNDNSRNDSREMYLNYSASVTFNDESENRGGFLSTPYHPALPEPTLAFNREYTTVVNGINGSSILGVL